ncbi:MAG: hypothetical protein ABI891_15285 [Acidobacteriota bacterium]
MLISKISKFISTLTLIILLLFVEQTANAQTNQWRPVSGSRHDNISGMALVEHEGNKTVFIIVNDNKKKEQNHAALVTIEGRNAPKYQPLGWIGDDVGVDFEAVSSVPSAKNEFMALTSTGRVFHIALDRENNSVKVLKSFDVPQIPAKHDFEGFALQKVNNILLAIWADRGLDAKPAQLFWSRFDLQSDAFAGETTSTFVKVPYPIGNTRHISDLKIDQSGAVFISSASDPGNDGPFSSAIYFAGTFNFCSAPKISFIGSPTLTRLFRFDYHKVEAIEFVPGADGGMAFGTDDENLGAAIYLNF